MTAQHRIDLDQPQLAPGDTVSIIAPSGPSARASLERAVRLFEGWGLRVVVGEHVLDRHPRAMYLAGSDEDRRADLVRAWADPAVDAVFCIRGGYGAMRLLDGIDWAALAAGGARRDGRQKVLAGSSDITALHEAFRVHLDVPGLFCPMPGTSVVRDSEFVREDLRRWLFEPWAGRELIGPKTEILAPGRAEGRFTGGNVSLLAAAIGAPEGRENPEGILFLEEITEEPYRLDNLLLQLQRSGRLDAASGIVLGSWEDCGEPDQVRDLLTEYCGGLGVPVLWEQGFGHDAHALTIPVNVAGVLDASGSDARLTVTGAAA
ncbi:S66 peptidase family protein [Leucobacter sp. M11]|uniref:S66 peptidase family protein n=1 Tax=Leucobacter sp. M11 TaxID=2993565 RepID=UPI002D80BD64|nr:LD-carboxypeptidase [Leucobacter sp. M11]MEB4613178.1 LD-carboxypeptidase [Leucobacter sp. M11]